MLYPIFLRLEDKLCLVVGGGQVAERKIANLLQAGAKVLVVSPEVTAQIEAWAGAGRLEWRRRLFQISDLCKGQLVFAATDSREINALIASLCKQEGLWVNVVDDPDGSDFHIPAVLTRGDLQLAVSSGGESPLLARKIRDYLATIIGPDFGLAATWLGELRRSLKTRIPDPAQRRQMLETLLNEEFWAELVRGEMDKVKERIFNVFGNSRS